MDSSIMLIMIIFKIKINLMFVCDCDFKAVLIMQ